MNLRAGDRFDAQFLAGAAEGPAVEEVGKAGRKAKDVEIALVEDNAADEAVVGVDAGAEHEAAGARLLYLDEDVLERARAVELRHAGTDAELGVHLEDVEAGQIRLGDFQLGIAQHLAGGDILQLAADDVVLRDVVAHDDHFAAIGDGMIVHLVVDLDHAGIVGHGLDGLLDVGLEAAPADIVGQVGDVFADGGLVVPIPLLGLHDALELFARQIFEAAFERPVLHAEAGAFLDVEDDLDEAKVVAELQFARHMHIAVAVVAVVGFELEDVVGDHGLVVFAAEALQERVAGFDLRVEAGGAGQLALADEADRADAQDGSFGDVEDDAVVLLLVAFLQRDVGEVIALLFQMLLQLVAGVLIRPAVERHAGVDAGEPFQFLEVHVLGVLVDHLAHDAGMLADFIIQIEPAVRRLLGAHGQDVLEQPRRRQP